MWRLRYHVAMADVGVVIWMMKVWRLRYHVAMGDVGVDDEGVATVCGAFCVYCLLGGLGLAAMERWLWMICVKWLKSGGYG